MKRIFLLFLMANSTLFLFAENFNALLLHLVSGKQVAYLLEEKPVVTFVSDELRISTHMSEVNYLLSDVLTFTYGYFDPSNVSRLEKQCMFSIMGDELSIRGMEPNTPIYVYSVDGSLIASIRTNKSGSASIDLSACDSGVYVVKSSITNFKIKKQ